MPNVQLDINKKRIAVIIVILCSLLNTLAQLSFKEATNFFNNSNVDNIIFNPFLILGYSLYAISLLFLAIALKKGELSYLYPFLGLSYVWIGILSPILFNSDHFVFIRFLGVLFIFIGISFIGLGSKYEN